jgi:hypothetical protein
MMNWNGAVSIVAGAECLSHVASSSLRIAWKLCENNRRQLSGHHGLYLGAGIMELLQDDPPPAKPSSENTETPDGPDGDGDGTIDLPNAVVYGSPPNGVDVDTVADTLANGAVDVGTAFPLGWDSENGEGVPEIGDIGGAGEGAGGEAG